MVISAAAFVCLRKSLSDPHVASVVFTTQQGMHGKKNCVKHFIYFFSLCIWRSIQLLHLTYYLRKN